MDLSEVIAVAKMIESHEKSTSNRSGNCLDNNFLDDSGCHGSGLRRRAGPGAVFRTGRHVSIRPKFDSHGWDVEKEGGEEITGKTEGRLKRPLGVRP